MPDMTVGMTAQVATFVRILNATQTSELLEWNLESLERALMWARAMETLASQSKASQSGDRVNELLTEQLPKATVPSMEASDAVLSVQVLEQATTHLCHSILTSPWLGAHSARSEFASHVIKHRLQHGDLVKCRRASRSLSATFTRQHQTEQRVEALSQIAERMSRGCKRVRVNVLSGWLEIPTRGSFLLVPRTLQLRALAKSLRANAAAARAQGPNHYEDFLQTLYEHLQQGDADVQETLAWMVVLDLNESTSLAIDSLAHKILALLEAQVTTHPQEGLYGVSAWLAAKLCALSASLQQQYVSTLVSTGLLRLDPEDFQTRIGALVLESHELQAIISHELRKLEPPVLKEHFHVI
ncbi:hypothetical protein Poli38472_012906 [Pythium oligandrum]|uniref:Uncharacterized protein n=1 Tax=Pythium oligandrum TaxID=41045 RepID=A0A8K1CIN7_PYTOL|nr:hypothetical protein Poli38472_012906 [Pythium oligandrum]|eukprot:TMW64284.1 hypothetical protein Poli38472_012906 [Pythium oligandrum]